MKKKVGESDETSKKHVDEIEKLKKQADETGNALLRRFLILNKE